MIVLFFNFWGIVCFPQWLHQFAFPSTVYKVPFSPYPGQYFVSLVFLMMATLTGMRWYFIVDLICISVMISTAEHLFMWVWATFCLLWEKKNLFRPSAHFFNWVVCFEFELYEYFPDTLDINLLSEIYYPQILFPI